jgi:hypothetical protein
VKKEDLRAERPPFTMVSDNIIDREDLTSYEKLVYIVLARHANKEGACWPGRARIAKMARCSVESVKRALPGLVEKGLLSIEPRKAESGRSDTNLYTVRLPQIKGEGVSQTRGRGSDRPGGRVSQTRKGLSIEGRPTGSTSTPSGGAKPQPFGREAKECLDYYFETYKSVRGFAPTIAGGRDMDIFMKFLRADYTVAAIKQVIDFFFSYEKRSKFSTRDLANTFDNLYGILRDQASGRRRHA